MLAAVFSYAQNTPQAGPPRGGFFMNTDPSQGLYSYRFSNVNYAGDELVSHNMDIYLPKGLSEGHSPKVIVVIYGSAWFSNNSKAAAMSSVGNALLEAGFAVATINHRSSMEAAWPAQINDVKAAIRYVRANADKYGYDASTIGITGYSSGGHLSAYAAVTNDVDVLCVGNVSIDIEGNIGQYTSVSSKVDAVVDWFGPVDMLHMSDDCSSPKDATSPEALLMGGLDPRTSKNWVMLISPVYLVTSSSPEILIIHGTADGTVPNCQSHILKESFDRAGVKATLVDVEGADHGPGCFEAPYYKMMNEYFTKQLNK